LLGIRKQINPKAFGLFLEGYINLQRINPAMDYSSQINYFSEWLIQNYSKGYSGKCWGYNFPWASPAKYLPAFAPTVVATAFVVRGLHQHFLLTGNEQSREAILSAAAFTKKDLQVIHTDKGSCISYTPLFKDCCYNASLLGAEILARAYSLDGDSSRLELIKNAVDFVVNFQHDDGHWNYSRDIVTGNERKQVDFHQGYVLDSIYLIKELIKAENEKWNAAIKRGADFYADQQFFRDGRSLWRWPVEYPVEIHNQSQGIITFNRLASIDVQYGLFAEKIAQWTIENMQDSTGYFYYRKMKYYTNKISFMRWSNAWMFLALSSLVKSK
jgi:hypothetical protein